MQVWYWEPVLQSLGCCCILCVDTLPGRLVGRGCALSEGSSALDHPVCIMKAKQLCACVCVRAYFCSTPHTHTHTPLWPALNYCLPIFSSSLQPFLSLLFHLTYCISPDRAPAFSFIHPFSLSLSLFPLFLFLSFLSVVPWLCRNVSSAQMHWSIPSWVSHFSVFYLLSPPVSSSPPFSGSTSIWCASFFHFYTTLLDITPLISPVFCFCCCFIPSPSSFCICSSAIFHFLSLCHCYLPICSLPSLPLPPCPHPSPLLSSLLAVFLWELVGGCGGPSWVIVCFDVLV